MFGSTEITEGLISYYYKTVSESSEKIPDKISSTYVNDINIIDIHNFILQKYQVLCNIYPDKKEDYKKICSKYKSESIPYVDIYYKLGRNNKVVSFAKKKIEKPEESEKLDMRLRTIKCFLAVAEKYIIIDVLHNVDTSDCNCPNCSTVLEHNDSGLQTCEYCGYEKIGFNINENMSTYRNNYMDRENFIKALEKYQGKIVPDKEVVEEIMKLLDKYFISYGMESGDVIRKKPLNKRNRKDGTSKELMYQAMSEINKPLYDFANYFCYVYWGWKLPDVTHLESQILADYDKTQVVLDSLQKSRKSSLNTQFRLLKHLELVNYPCSIDDFRIIKTRSIIEEHNYLWSLMVKEVGLKFIPTI